MSITTEQIKKIHTLKTKYGIEELKYRRMLEDRYSVPSSVDLTEEQASDFIEFLIEITGDTYGQEKKPEEQPQPQEEIAKLNGAKLKEIITNLCEFLPKAEILKLFLNKTTVEQNKHIVRELLNAIVTD